MIEKACYNLFPWADESIKSSVTFELAHYDDHQKHRTAYLLLWLRISYARKGPTSRPRALPFTWL